MQTFDLPFETCVNVLGSTQLNKLKKVMQKIIKRCLQQNKCCKKTVANGQDIEVKRLINVELILCMLVFVVQTSHSKFIWALI